MLTGCTTELLARREFPEKGRKRDGSPFCLRFVCRMGIGSVFEGFEVIERYGGHDGAPFRSTTMRSFA